MGFFLSDPGLGHRETIDVVKLRIHLNLSRSRAGVWAERERVEGWLSGFSNASCGQVIIKSFIRVCDESS